MQEVFIIMKLGVMKEIVLANEVVYYDCGNPNCHRTDEHTHYYETNEHHHYGNGHNHSHGRNHR